MRRLRVVQVTIAVTFALLMLGGVVPLPLSSAAAPSPRPADFNSALSFAQQDPVLSENETSCGYDACYFNVTSYLGSTLLIFMEGASDECYVGGTPSGCTYGAAWPEMNETGLSFSLVVNNTTPPIVCVFACFPTLGFSALYALYDAPSLTQVPVYANNSSLEFVMAAVDVGNVTAAPFVSNGSANTTNTNGTIVQFCNTTETGQFVLSGWESSWTSTGVFNLWLGYPSANLTFNGSSPSGEVSANGFAEIVPTEGTNQIATVQVYEPAGNTEAEFGSAVCVTLQPSAPVAPTASFVFNATPAQVKVNETFLPSVSGGVAPYTFAWTFGDGGSSTAETPVHAYSTAGNYTVILHVTDALGQVGSAARTVWVHPAVTPTPPSPTPPSPLAEVPVIVWILLGLLLLGGIAAALDRRRR